MYIIIMNTLVYVILNTSIISLTPISTMIQLYGMCQCICGEHRSIRKKTTELPQIPSRSNYIVVVQLYTRF